jgi:ribosome-associated protein
MIEITGDIHIPDSELKEDFIRSSGPGGQNVNKVSTAVQLRFDVKNSSSLPENIRRRLTLLAGKRMTKDGVLVIKAERHRTREQNRRDAIERLAALIVEASKAPKYRVKTAPSFASREKRIDSKLKRGKIKKFRGKVSSEELI